jgi:hypothetical protein
MAESHWIRHVSGYLTLGALTLAAVPAGSSMPGTFTAFEAPGAGTSFGRDTSAQTINAYGEIAGYYTDREDALHGFVRHNNGIFTEFDAPGASTTSGLGTSAQCISDDGAVAGYYLDAKRVRHG